MQIGIQLYKDGKYEEALAALLRAELDAEDHGLFSYYLGLCYARLKRFDEALLYLEQVVTSNLGFGITYQCRMLVGFIYSETERWRMAAWEFQRLLNEGFESAKVYAALGHVQYLEKNIEASIDTFERALKLEPDNSNALNSMGFVLADSGRKLGQALLYCQKAVAKSPRNPAYLDSLGWVYFKLGKKREAMEILRRAVLLDPERKTIKEHLRVVVDQNA